MKFLILALTALFFIGCTHDYVVEDPAHPSLPSGLSVFPNSCGGGADCTALGAVVVAEAIGQMNSPPKDPLPGTSESSLLIICHQITNEMGMDVACPRSKIVINLIPKPSSSSSVTAKRF